MRSDIADTLMLEKNASWNRSHRSRKKYRDDKILLRLIAEERRLNQACWDAPLIELEEPFQRGWVRCFVLSKSARNRRNSENMEALLKYIGKSEYCRRKNYTFKHPKTKKWEAMPFNLSRLHVWYILKRKMPERLYKYFFNHRGESLGCRAAADRFRRASFGHKFGIKDITIYEVKIEPFIVTHKKVVLTDVERRLAEIDNYMKRENGWFRWRHLKGYRNSNSWLKTYEPNGRLDESRARDAEQFWRDEIMGALNAETV